MRLICKNIKFVREHVKNDVPYAWHAVMESKNISDTKSFFNYDLKTGWTTDDEYKKERLPKEVKRFLEGNTIRLYTRVDEDYGYYTYLKVNENGTVII